MKHNFYNLKSGLVFLCIAGVSMTACTKVEKDDNFPKGDPPPVAGGYTNSDQVAASSLLAYWSFDGDNKEKKSGIAPSVERNNSFVTGIKGQALHLNAGYLFYPTIAALSSANAIASCTVSLWINVANNGTQASEFFALTQAPATQSDWLAILNVAIESGRPTSTSNLTLHSWIGSYPAGSRKGGDNINDYGNVGVDYQTFAGANKWVHYIMRYDAATEAIDLYANNIRVSNNNFRIRTGLGPLVMPTPTNVLIGGFPTASTGYPLSGDQSWQAKLNGSIDELRVYGKAFTDQEISALFQLERQGR